jgi:hypothetical protein
MMEVSPFHSKNHLAVYHTCSRCGIAKKIHPSNRMSGTGGLRLCLRCEKLLAQRRSQRVHRTAVGMPLAGWTDPEL